MATEVSTIAAKMRDDFSELELNDSNWNLTLGPGASIDLTQASALRISAGTTANSETVLRSIRTWITPFRAMFLAQAAALVSQRIANQEIEFRVVSPDGKEYASWVLDGTTTTTYKLRSANGAVAATDSSATSLADSSNGSVILELETFPDEVYWHQRVADSSNGRTYSGVRNRRVPDPSREMHIEVRIKNGATAPASNTIVSLDAILLQDINELTAEITGGRGGGAVSQAIPVAWAGAPTINTNGGEVTPRIVSSVVDPLTTTNLGVSGIFAQTAVDNGTNFALRPTRHRPTVMHLAGLTPGTLVFEESTDNTTFRETWRSPIPSDGLYHTFDIPRHLRYTRFRFLNGATAQTGFFLSDIAVRGEGPTDLDKVLAFPLTAAAGQALAANAVFTGPTIDLGGNHQWDQVKAFAKSDVANAASGFALQQSSDGTNWHVTPSSTANLTNAATSGILLESPVFERYVRVVNTQGAAAGSFFFAALSLYSN